MAITRVSDVYRQDTTSTSPSLSIGSTTAGNGLIVVFFWGLETVSLSSVTMSGETITAFTNTLVTPDSSFHMRAQLYYVKNLASGGTKTASGTLSSSVSWSMAIMEITGQNTSVFDDGTGNVAFDTSVSVANPTVNITPTVSDCFLFGATSAQSGNATPGSGFTAPSTAWPEFNFYNNGEYLADYASTSTKAVNFTHSADRWLITAAAVRPAGGAPSGGARLVAGIGGNFGLIRT